MTKAMKNMIRIISGILMSGIITFGAVSVPALAVETIPVSGTVAEGTTTTQLNLNTSDGLMKLKIDGSADLTSGRYLIVGQKVAIACYRGNDAWMHVNKVTSLSSDNGDTVVTGVVDSDTTPALLVLSTGDGDMKIKVDSNTTYSNVGPIVVDQKLDVSVYRGSDAYMHASRIAAHGSSSSSGSSSSGSSSSSSSSKSTVTTGANMVAVTGYIHGESTSDLMKLETDSGIMLLKLDSNTDLLGNKVLFEDNKVTVACYRGSDAYMHAAQIANNTAGIGKAATLSDAFEVTGKVAGDSNSGMLYLNTSGGKMSIVIDPNTQSNFRILRHGSQITVTCARGSDAYMHAVKIK